LIAAAQAPAPSPTLTSASVVFATGSDNKDQDSEVEIFLKRSDGHGVGYVNCCKGIEFNDRTQSNSIGVPLSELPPKSQIVHGILTIKLRANGNDAWDYCPKLHLAFSDGSTADPGGGPVGCVGANHTLESHHSQPSGDDNWAY
jgi:hypothetical protein